MITPPKPRLPDDDEDPNDVPTVIARRPSLPVLPTVPPEPTPEPAEPEPKP